METHRLFASLASVFAIAASQADIYMGLAVDKSFIQQGPFKVNFVDGELNLLLRDGLVIIDGSCVTQPQPVPFAPSAIPPCPLGSTGFVAQGDIDRDGVRDDLQYWSVLSIIRAFLIEPSRPELCLLAAAPASKLPRPLQNFRDDSVVTFYNTNLTSMTDYSQSRYELIRRYGPTRQVESLRILGTVLNDGFVNVSVTGQSIPNAPFVIQVPVLEGMSTADFATAIRVALGANPNVSSVYDVDGEDGLEQTVVLTEAVPNGNDSTLLIRISSGSAIMNALPINSINTTVGAVGASGGGGKQMAEEIVPGQYIFTYPRLDAPDTATPVAIPALIQEMPEALGSGRNPRQGFRFTSGSWDGNFIQFDPRVITRIDWVGNDRSVIRPGDQIYFSIENDTAPGGSAVDGRDFPPTGNQVRLESASVTGYTLPPFFLNVGDEGDMTVTYRRNLPSNAVAFDVSSRVFQAKVRMIDTYNGFAQISFPLATPKQEFKTGSDIDRDGMNNLNEYAFEWPTKELLIAEGENPELLGVGDPAAVDPLVRPVLPVATLDASNHIVVKASIRPLTGTSLRYSFSILDTSGKKPRYRLIKPGAAWTITESQELEAVQIGADLLELPRDYVILRSTSPVANPAGPLPDIQVKVSSVAIK